MSALTLIIVGLVICFIAFVFATVNMIGRATRHNQFSKFSGMFKKHIVAMIILALGGLIFLIGLIIAGVNLFERVQY